uniref:Propionyl-CoA carboxylase alpha chain, mitochondrial n=1 Tax=Arcella intermedia TaxID=1963864 RepID=A0A6B2KZI5_9EUKA
MFDKILIANRGEIACRVISSAKKLGIKTVAVHSDVDLFSKHVKMADEAVNIGPPLSSQSYLKIDKILDAVKLTGAQAVHPGYGFLSENNQFVAELEKNNIVFIGPGSHAISAMGDKIESKKLAKEAGVNVIPGYMGVVETVEDALKKANEVGYPVMIKASAGGGGKGMRIAWNDAEAREGYRLSKQEALASFGDDRLLIERYIDNPRHIEIQVLCDSFGNSLWLNERECSIQRRNQKVYEEAPSPALTPEVRKAMGDQAVALCKKVGYRSAGTVEFLVDSKLNFYFLEMNTRLQVEHPITEFITGLDLVEWMIKIAAGQPLTLQQQDIPINGWAMEARVYAEDPLRNFLPSIGKLVTYKEPGKNDPSIRVDSGVTEGAEISIYYDPLISKLITYGKDRPKAIAKMKEALDSYVIRGVKHNVNFLRDVLENKRYNEGNISTKFIPEEYPEGFSGHKLTPKEEKHLLSIAAGIHHLRFIRDSTITEEEPTGARNYVLKFKKEYTPVKVNEVEEKTYEVFLNGETEPSIVDLTNYKVDSLVITAPVDGVPNILQLIKVRDLGYDLQFCGTTYGVDVLSPLEAKLLPHMKEIVPRDTSNLVLSPMAGTLLSISVKVGEHVHVGQELALVEAMKMQNIIRATRDGVVKSISDLIGKPITFEEVLIEFQKK